MNANEYPRYIKFDYSLDDYMDTKDIIATSSCPVCYIQIRSYHRAHKAESIAHEEHIKDKLVKQVEACLLDHLNNHYLTPNWDKPYKMFEHLPQCKPKFWQRIKWALTGKKNKDELWVI